MTTTSILSHALRRWVWAGLLALLVPGLAAAATPLPKIPKPRAKFSATQDCVQPIPEMRRNHMKYILHHRDETMHQGIRTTRYSLKACINCHVQKDPKTGEYPSIETKDHFCNSCHSYAAVHIDCFQCHSTRPVEYKGYHPLARR